jgi:WD40 repeat protein
MWDIRSGKQMTTIKDHNSDVYAIAFNPARPFTFASCSRDTTIRLFSIDGMISKLKMQLFFNEKLSS